MMFFARRWFVLGIVASTIGACDDDTCKPPTCIAPRVYDVSTCACEGPGSADLSATLDAGARDALLSLDLYGADLDCVPPFCSTNTVFDPITCKCDLVDMTAH